MYAGINACTDVTKVENLEGLEELTHQLHGWRFRWHCWQYACFHSNAVQLGYFPHAWQVMILQRSDNGICCINYINFNPLALELSAKGCCQKKRDSNSCLLLCIFYANDFRWYSVFPASHCALTKVIFRHQTMKKVHKVDKSVT